MAFQTAGVTLRQSMVRMRRKLLNLRAFFGAVAIAAGVSGGLSAQETGQSLPPPSDPFQSWLAELTAEAQTRGISATTLEVALAGVEPIPRVIELDRQQPEFTQTFWRYLDTRASNARIEEGRRLLRQHRDLLTGIETKYGVQGRFLVAFWGLETNFGQYLGGFPVIDALATLAFDERRSAFFRAELFDALSVLEGGHIARENMVGSWAGAMGQPQFMPSTFARHAVDEDGDGRKDIWGTLPDVFGSAANYLSSLGWDNDYTWGREVRLPQDFDLDLADLRVKKPLAEWQTLGVRRIDGRDLPAADIDGAVVVPAGIRGPAFLVYGNFDAIMTWNRSLLYAISVGHLADRLIGLGSLQSPRRAEEPLSRDDVTALQTGLNTLGFYAGRTGRTGRATHPRRCQSVSEKHRCACRRVSKPRGTGCGERRTRRESARSEPGPVGVFLLCGLCAHNMAHPVAGEG